MTAVRPLRIAVWALALALLALPLVGLFMGWYATSHWPVRSLRVDGSFQHVSADVVRDRVRPMLHDGFFAIDPQAIRRAVAALPWVAGVEVRRHWPDQVRIRVTEQQAFARWNGGALVNRDGAVFEVPDAASYQQLPRLAGPADSVEQVVRFFVAARVQFAGVGLDLAEVRLSRRGAWRAELANGARIMIGRNKPRRHLARFVAALAQLGQARRRGFVSADLRYANGFALRPQAVQAPIGGSPRA